MHRRALVALLAFGTIAGYASGFASLYRWHRYGSPHGGHCRHGQSSNAHPAPWAPPPASQAPAPTPGPS
jgi:hypothetical protein